MFLQKRVKSRRTETKHLQQAFFFLATRCFTCLAHLLFLFSAAPCPQARSRGGYLANVPPLIFLTACCRQSVWFLGKYPEKNLGVFPVWFLSVRWPLVFSVFSIFCLGRIQPVGLGGGYFSNIWKSSLITASLL